MKGWRCVFVLYLAQRAPIVANPIICERYIKRADMNRGPLLLSHKLNTHFLSSKRDLVYVMHHGCDKTGKSICGILSPTLMEGAHLFVGTLGYYRNPRVRYRRRGITIPELLFSLLVLKIDLFKWGWMFWTKMKSPNRLICNWRAALNKLKMLWKEMIVFAVKYEFNTAGNNTIIHIVVALFLCPWADYNVLMLCRVLGAHRSFAARLTSAPLAILSRSIAWDFQSRYKHYHFIKTSLRITRVTQLHRERSRGGWDDVKESSDSVMHAWRAVMRLLLRRVTFSCRDSRLV